MVARELICGGAILTGALIATAFTGNWEFFAGEVLGIFLYAVLWKCHWGKSPRAKPYKHPDDCDHPDCRAAESF